jgi:ATP-dependent helicase/nuclease subunit B
LIYELSAQYGMPCTYAEGIPVFFSRSGQAVLAYLDWLDGDHDANTLSRMIGADVVDLRKIMTEPEPTGTVRAAQILRDAGAGWGRDRYLSCLDDLIQAYSERRRTGGEDEAMIVRQEFHGRQMAAARLVRSFVGRLLQITPETDTEGKMTLRELARGTATFVEEFARIGGELDGMASMALRKLLDELSVLPETRLTPQEAVKRVRGAVKGTYVGASTPEPGHLHISDCSTGGYSGREYTFILGMDESRHPGIGLQDPVLPDNERRTINRLIRPRRLPLLRERPEENQDVLRGCLARLRGQITVSYSCRSLLEDREQFPSAMVLEIYRLVNDQPEADFTTMRSTLGPPAGFLPTRPIYLDETEWWLGHLRGVGKRGEEISAIARVVYPWLQRGWHAGQERSSNRFTVFDGWVKDSDGELDPRLNREPMSCTQIETLARCPFAYFLRYVLEIEPPEDWSRDPTVWLDPMEFGSLLHEIFRAFMTEVAGREEKPNFTRHWAVLKDIAEGCLDRWRRRVPPPNIPAFTTQRRHVLLTCQTFLKEEEVHCQRVTPHYFEVPFGVPGFESEGPLASQAPVSIDLGEGNNFSLRGSVDRIDHAGGDEYEVWDYKSGSTRVFREEKQLNRGRQIQHALYARAVEILLARIQKRGSVVRSGYFFPGPRADGDRIVKRQDTVSLQRVLNALFNLLREGVFPYAPDSDFCRFCEFQGVCGGSEKANEWSTLKLENDTAPNAVLEPFRRLIDCDD